MTDKPLFDTSTNELRSCSLLLTIQVGKTVKFASFTWSYSKSAPAQYEVCSYEMHFAGLKHHA